VGRRTDIRVKANLNDAFDMPLGELFYAGTPDYNAVVLSSPAFNLVVMAAIFVVFMAVGTFLFVRGEQSRCPRRRPASRCSEPGAAVAWLLILPEGSTAGPRRPGVTRQPGPAARERGDLWWAW